MLRDFIPMAAAVIVAAVSAAPAYAQADGLTLKAETQAASAPTMNKATQASPSRPAALVPLSPVAEDSAYREMWAQNTARAQALMLVYRQLCELKTAEGSTVGDFLAAAPAASFALAAMLSQTPGQDPPRHPNGNMVEVTLSVPADEAIRYLTEVRNRFGRFSPIKPEDLQQFRRKLPDVLTQTARAAPPEALIANPLIPRMPGGNYWEAVSGPVRRYWLTHVSEAGRRQAEQSARDNAFHLLTERIKQVYIDPQRRLVDYVGAAGLTTQPATARAAGSARTATTAPALDLGPFLQAARERGLRYYASAPLVEVELQVSLRSIYANLKTAVHVRRLGKPEDVPLFEQFIVNAGQETLEQIGLGQPLPDQLVDAPLSASRPADWSTELPAWVSQPLRQTTRSDLPAAPTPSQRAAARQAATIEAACLLGRRCAELPLGKGTVGEMAAKDPANLMAVMVVMQEIRPLEAVVAGQAKLEVVLEMPLTPLWRLLSHQQRQE